MAHFVRQSGKSSAFLKLSLLLALACACLLPLRGSKAGAASSIPNFSFLSNTSVNSRVLVVDDFNKDGKPDVATAGVSTITVFLGNGAGGFTALSPFLGVRNANSIASGDLNGDGNADLVVANNGNVEGDICIFPGNGAGGFGPRIQVFLTSPGSQNVSSEAVIADFNGDGKPDVAVTNETFHGIIIALGDGTGRVTFFTATDAGVVFPTSLIARDLNGDGKVDLITCDPFSTRKVSVLLNDGTGKFGAPTTFAAGEAPGGMTAGDFDGDGKVDLALLSSGVTVIKGDGAGRFGSPVSIPVGPTGLRAVRTADLNADGLLDLAVGTTRGNLLILIGNGMGGFTLVANYFESILDIESLDIGDFNKDGQPDVVAGKSFWFATFLNSCGSAATSQVRVGSSTSASESFDPAAVVTIVRTGDITGSASVEYATSNHTAIAPQDYTATSGTMNFAPGTFSQMVSVLIVDDSLPEITEDFNFIISNALGSSILGTPTTFPVLISDNDASRPLFSSSSLTVNEGVGNATIQVLRTGNTALAATVDYTTSDTSGGNNCNGVSGNASARCDYITTAGRLSFAPNETQKTLGVPIIDDSYFEGPEHFKVTLANPGGNAVLEPFTNTTLDITVTDNDTANGPNPIDFSSFFVRQHYLDFLNRQPDQSGLDFWVGTITSCGSDPQCIEVKRINLSGAFFVSIEFQQTGYLVERLYKTAYGDATGNSTLPSTHTLPVPIVRFNEFLADTQEIGRGLVVGQPGWEQQLENNKVAFVASFVQRQRFTNAFGAMSNAQFVDTLNANAGNPLPSSERDQLLADLNSSGKARAQILRAIAEHPNFVTSEFNRAFVLMQFFGYLRRDPNDAPEATLDYTGYDFWLTKLNQFGGNFQNAEMVKAFITSDEYRHRFGP